MSEYKTYTKYNNLTFNEYLGKVFGTIAIGLGITAVVAFFVSTFYVKLLYSLGALFVILMFGSLIAEVVIAIVLGAKLMQLQKSTAWGLYIAYSVLNGISLSSILLTYTTGSIWVAFIVSAIMFISMSIIGQTTKTDLSKFSGMVLPALIALIVGTILNALIFRSNMFSWVLTYVGIIIFLVLIAMDIQKLRDFYSYSFEDSDAGEKLMVIGAFQLYLDFINLFIRVLSIFGKRKD